MPKIMVSYRRSDSQQVAERIRDWLAQHYGDRAIYFDIYSVPDGSDYRDHIRTAIRGVDVLVAIIGRSWIGRNAEHKPRILEQDDPVRVEIETALASGIPVVPVLVNGGKMPTARELPASLEPLCYRNAAVVESGRDFRTHMERLILSLDRLIKRASFIGWLRSPLALTTGSMTSLAVAGAILWVAWPSTSWLPFKTASSGVASAEIIPTDANGYVIADSSERYLSEDELRRLSPSQLRIARNEIFARKGRFFRDPKLAAHFSSRAWYNPRFVDVQLSTLEESNVALIQTVERSR